MHRTRSSLRMTQPPGYEPIKAAHRWRNAIDEIPRKKKNDPTRPTCTYQARRSLRGRSLRFTYRAWRELNARPRFLDAGDQVEQSLFGQGVRARSTAATGAAAVGGKHLFKHLMQPIVSLARTG